MAPGTGRAALLPTAIYLDTSGTQAQKKLKWVRDTNNNGVFDSGDKTIVLANNVVNTAAAVNKKIFTYLTYSAGTYTMVDSITSTNAASVIAVNITIVVDANLNDKPAYIDFVSTVHPRNSSATN